MPNESIWSDFAHSPDSLIVSTLSDIFNVLSKSQFLPVWRSSRDDFAAKDLHMRRDDQIDILTWSLDRNANSLGESSRTK
jgi:hypothetical protein